MFSNLFYIVYKKFIKKQEQGLMVDMGKGINWQAVSEEPKMLDFALHHAIELMKSTEAKIKMLRERGMFLFKHLFVLLGGIFFMLLQEQFIGKNLISDYINFINLNIIFLLVLLIYTGLSFVPNNASSTAYLSPVDSLPLAKDNIEFKHKKVRFLKSYGETRIVNVLALSNKLSKKLNYIFIDIIIVVVIDVIYYLWHNYGLLVINLF